MHSGRLELARVSRGDCAWKENSMYDLPSRVPEYNTLPKLYLTVIWNIKVKHAVEKHWTTPIYHIFSPSGQLQDYIFRILYIFFSQFVPGGRTVQV